MMDAAATGQNRKPPGVAPTALPSPHLPARLFPCVMEDAVDETSSSGEAHQGPGIRTPSRPAGSRTAAHAPAPARFRRPDLLGNRLSATGSDDLRRRELRLRPGAVHLARSSRSPRRHAPRGACRRGSSAAPFTAAFCRSSWPLAWSVRCHRRTVSRPGWRAAMPEWYARRATTAAASLPSRRFSCCAAGPTPARKPCWASCWPRVAKVTGRG